MREMGSGFGTIDRFEGLPTPPSGGSGSALGPLLGTVMAGLAQGLQVCVVPEQPLITPMSLDVIGDQLGGLALQATAHATCERISHKDGPAQLPPPGRVVTLAPRLPVAEPVRLLLVLREEGYGGGEAAKR